MPQSKFDHLREKLRKAVKKGADLAAMRTYVETLLADRPPEFVATHGPLLRQYADWYFHAHARRPGDLFWSETFGAPPDLAIPKEIEEYETRQREARFPLERMRIDAMQRGAERKKKRLAMGLCAVAGSGEPGCEVKLLESIRYGAIPEPEYIGDDTIDHRPEEATQARAHRLPIGASRIGGVPDLPANVGWPTFNGKMVPFIAQINIADLPKPASALLANDGWLYVFWRMNYEEPIIFAHRCRAPSLKRCECPAEETIWPNWSSGPTYDCVPVESPSNLDDVKDFVKRDRSGKPDLQDGDDWINLLALRSSIGGLTAGGHMEWCECGALYILIRRSDLLAGDFSKVFAHIDST